MIPSLAARERGGHRKPWIILYSLELGFRNSRAAANHVTRQGGTLFGGITRAFRYTDIRLRLFCLGELVRSSSASSTLPCYWNIDLIKACCERDFNSPEVVQSCARVYLTSGGHLLPMSCPKTHAIAALQFPSSGEDQPRSIRKLSR